MNVECRFVWRLEASDPQELEYKLNSDPPKMQQVLLTTESPLQHYDG